MRLSNSKKLTNRENVPPLIYDRNRKIPNFRLHTCIRNKM